MRMLMWGGLALLLSITAVAASGILGKPPMFLGVRVEFVLFALTLVGVALFHNRSPEVTLTGLLCLLAVILSTSPNFSFVEHVHHEASILINLFGLLIGFALLAYHFEKSGAPDLLPAYLPDGIAGAFSLLVVVFIMSGFLDNIAAAVIGAAAAKHLFHGKVHIGYLAAIVAASNAGGAGSVLGDTTTTMMWINGVAALDVLHAYVAAVPALIICGFFAARQQNAYQRIQRDATPGIELQWRRLLAVVMVLIGAVITNLWLDFPAVGVWAALLLAALFVKTDWKIARRSLRGAVFLTSLVFAASMMPVEALPEASWRTTLGLGFLSSVFDNIPLTKLALDQGGYDWGMLAFAVGYGGSMIWFGSSAGVAVSGLFPEIKSVGRWLKDGWHVVLAYLIGFTILLAVMGWHPHAPHRDTANEPAAAQHSP